MFEELGARIIDADEVARAVVEPGEPAWKHAVTALKEKKVAVHTLGCSGLNEDATRTFRLVAELTKGEFSLLAAFLSAPQRILAREQLLDLSRLHNAEVYDRSIDVQILRLRRKIEVDPSHPRFIVTERGVGYIFNSPVETVR